MGSWSFENIGASTIESNIKYVEKIFSYMGYRPDPKRTPDGDECSFIEPKVYSCRRNGFEGFKSRSRVLDSYGVEDLRNLLNALFPGTFIYTHAADGNNTSDCWENHDEVYNPDNMTCYGFDSYTEYGGNPSEEYWKARFILEAPPIEYVQALINVSKDDGDEELTELLNELAQKIRNNEIVYVDDSSDKRIVDEKYDIVKTRKANNAGCHQKIFGRYYSGTKIQIQLQSEVQLSQYKKYKDNISQMLVTISFDDYLRKSMEKAIKGTTDSIALDAEIVFDGKRFAIDPGFPFLPEMKEEIRIRGGLFNTSGIVRKTDYYVVDLELRGEYSPNILNRAQEFQRLGYGLQIITEYQLWNALFDESKPILPAEELEDRRIKEEEEGQRKIKEAEEKKERHKAEHQLMPKRSVQRRPYKSVINEDSFSDDWVEDPQGEEWWNEFEPFIEVDPDIYFNGTVFAFSGLRNDRDTPVIQKVIDKGGQYRKGVSGKTNYLVVNPEVPSRSMIEAAIEQQQKRDNIKIVLLEDVKMALGYIKDCE